MAGAPEFFSNGAKLLTAPSEDGKLRPASIHAFVGARSDIHFPKPRVVTITQSNEMGLVYTIEEIRALSAACKKHGLSLHMDGARFANACASLGCSPAEMTWQAGVDVLCFGGTKNGMAVSEAVIFFNSNLALDFDYRCKQAGQLASKMRFLSAPWARLIKTGTWLINAARANGFAQSFAQSVQQLPGVDLIFPVQANGVFLNLSSAVQQALRARGWIFYTLIGGAARFMFSLGHRPGKVG